MKKRQTHQACTARCFLRSRSTSPDYLVTYPNGRPPPARQSRGGVCHTTIIVSLNPHFVTQSWVCHKVWVWTHDDASVALGSRWYRWIRFSNTSDTDTVPPCQRRRLWRQQSLRPQKTLGCGLGVPGSTQYVHCRRTTGEEGQNKGEQDFCKLHGG
jgi:hypothetical protein